MKPIAIAGGGLAGLTLGILLRRDGVPASILESGNYPRHRVCGEFISGRAREVLRAAGLDSKLPWREGRNAAFFIRGRRTAMELPEPALCISRFELDARLASEFQALGGELRVNERVSPGPEPGMVRATGRRRAETGRGHLFGLKAHAADATLSADLELHFGPNQYVGICRLPGERVNVCGLFYSRNSIPNLQREWRHTLAQPVSSPALAGARWIEDSFTSVAGLTLDREQPDGDFTVGDAAAMIPPLTGNGMSMAFESAALAHKCLMGYCAGRKTWTEALAEHQAGWRCRFENRLRWAGFVQRLVFASATQEIFFWLVRLWPALPGALFARTR